MGNVWKRRFLSDGGKMPGGARAYRAWRTPRNPRPDKALATIRQ
ncbi:hypothetical protein HMPREF3207_01125 [Citrobacter koseri]|nr:hypothetical protein HMPREF3207_01125 [Citrobacter koseri]